ncbi:MAG: hypothetical protein WBH09_07585 [Rugosibacter sp.]
MFEYFYAGLHNHLETILRVGADICLVGRCAARDPSRHPPSAGSTGFA